MRAYLCTLNVNAFFYYYHLKYPVYDPNPKQNVVLIQEEIMKNGPVEATYWVFSDFVHLVHHFFFLCCCCYCLFILCSIFLVFQKSYINGVYKRTPGSTFLGGHAVKIIGWGVDEETRIPYWLVVNSWGTSWGSSGLFKIRRGTNECGIESEVVAGLP